MFGNTVYKLSLTKNYVSRWGVLEAVRELIQNSLDSDSPFSYSFTGATSTTTLILRSEFTTLLPATLLLGATSKADSEDAIGSFGEGYKLALLVLTRLEHKVEIHNGNKLWSPKFAFDKNFGQEILTVEETELPFRHTGLTFIVYGLTETHVEGIRGSCLKMQSEIGQRWETPKGDILVNKPGELYVGGLFVCKTDLAHGYNILPNCIKLERDRQTVDGFDLKFTVKEMWFSTKQYDTIAAMIEAKIPDLEYAEYGSPDIVKEACYRRFKEKYPNHVVAKSQEELNELVKKGMTNTVIVSSGSYYNNIVDSPSYRNEVILPPKDTPVGILKNWLEENRKHMRRSAIVAFEALITTAEKWRM